MNGQNSPDVSRRRLLAASVVAGGSVLLFVLATSPGLPMAWDEGNAINRAEGIGRWARSFAPGGSSPWSRAEIAQDWQYTTAVEGHPAFYGIVIALGRWAAPGWLDPLTQARFGPIVLFGLAAGAMFYRIGRDESLVAAVGSVAALVLLPRLFAHVHFASFDGPLTSCWILAWATFPTSGRAEAGRAAWPHAILWGAMLGLTLSTKATGWIAPAPFVLWTLAYRDRTAAKALAIGLPVALLTFELVNPPLWHQPVQGLATFFHLNFHRADELGLNITTCFLGRIYDLDHPLPAYNTLFWTAITVPVGLLALAAAGLVAAVRSWRSRPLGMLVVANWAALMVVRALPGVPPHDGVRLFLPAFAFLAVLIGLGAAACVGAFSRAAYCRGVAIVLLYLGSATSLSWYSPQWLSYYNLLVGGLRGATAIGMEPTYYWDALDRSVLDWLAANSGPGDKVYFADGSPENLAWLQRWGRLKVEFQPDAPGAYRWYVLQHRPGAWQPLDQWLVVFGRPTLVKTIRSGGYGPWRLDVPLIEVYPFEQIRAIMDGSRPGEEVPGE